jgi:hypothetical protein
MIADRFKEDGFAILSSENPWETESMLVKMWVAREIVKREYSDGKVWRHALDLGV